MVGIELMLMHGLTNNTFAQSNLPINSSHQPLKYRIAFIDPRFQLTKEQLVEVSQQAAEIWQKKLGRPILFMIHRLNCQLT